ncbi:MAG: hypothetical protein HY814_13250, partial [Candidatus Riflebacteria bacterium]|nr:hypothetical protein [Candidatus Riflebacteria bacterium]
VATLAAPTVVDLVGNRQDADYSQSGTVDTSAPSVTLTYNREDRLYGAGTFQLTATFTEEITPAAPTVSLPGTLGGGSVSEVAMTPVVGRTNWTYSTTILACDTQGTRTVTLGAADAAGNALDSQPGNNTFSVEMPPAVLAVTFSRGLEGLPAGTWSVTVDYSEPVGTTPALTWSTGTSTLTVSGPVRVSDTRFVFDVVVVGGASEPAFGDPFTLTVSGAVDLLGNPQVDVALRRGRVQTRPADPGRCTWVQRSPSTRPSGRSGSAMTYDSARNRVVLFGGYASSYVHDTWEYDGATWTQVNPVSRPSARIGHAMAYDSARGRAVLFGGYDGSYSQDTWEYDGVNWTLMNPASRPLARYDHAMVYDSARGRMVLFGGQIGSHSYVQDTWEYDGATWTQVSSASRPSARYAHDMTYDGARGRVMLFGGCVSSYSYLDDTWEYDGVRWTQVGSASRPGSRGSHAMALDAARSRMVLFGGVDYSSNLQDTWEYHGGNWARVSPASGPGARQAHAMSYDGARGRVVLFGGWDGSYRQDTWEYAPLPEVAALTFSQGPGYLRAGPLAVTADFSEDLTSSITPTLAFAPSAHFTFADPAPSRISPTRFIYNTTVMGTTPQAGVSYVATVAASTVVDLMGNLQDSDWSRSGTVDTSAPAVTLTYNHEDRLYGAGTFQLTATFNEDIGPAAPFVSIPGRLGGGDVTLVPMTPVVGRTSWAYSTPVLAGDSQGTRTVMLTAADAAGNTLGSQPENNTFSVEMPPAVLAVTFSRGLEGLPAGTWRVTVDYSEPVGTTPALTWSAGTSTFTVGGPVRVSDTLFVFDVVVVGGATEQLFGDPFTLTVTGATDLLGNPQVDVALRRGWVRTKPADPGRCTWVQRSPSSSPSTRCRHAMAFDSTRDRTLLFGGWAGSYAQDTWEYDGGNWTQV